MIACSCSQRRSNLEHPASHVGKQRSRQIPVSQSVSSGPNVPRTHHTVSKDGSAPLGQEVKYSTEYSLAWVFSVGLLNFATVEVGLYQAHQGDLWCSLPYTTASKFGF
jgi:hypothetical protein